VSSPAEPEALFVRHPDRESSRCRLRRTFGQICRCRHVGSFAEIKLGGPGFDGRRRDPVDGVRFIVAVHRGRNRHRPELHRHRP